MIRLEIKWYSYVLAVLLGFFTSVVPSSLLRTYGVELIVVIVGFGVVNMVAGFVFGFIYPEKSWRWGLWLGSTPVLLTLISVAFAGFIFMFLTRALPVLIVVTGGASVGAFLGSWVRSRKAGREEAS